MTFEKLTDKMVKNTEKRINKAHRDRDWGRVLILEGFKSGLEQALAHYRVSQPKGEVVKQELYF